MSDETAYMQASRSSTLRPSLPTTRKVFAGLLATGLVLMAGCSSGSSSDGGSATTPSEAATSTTEPVPTDAVLAALALADDDLVAGEQAVVPTDGTTVVAERPALEFCAVELPSDAARVARHRVQIADADVAPVASSEAVRYEAGAAASALDEIEAAFASCPEGESVEVDGEPVTFAAVPIDEAELGGLADERVAADVTVTTDDGEAQVRMVFQQRGDVVVATIGVDPERVLALASEAGARLEAADGADIGD